MQTRSLTVDGDTCERSPTCLGEKLSKLAPISENQRDILAALEERPESKRAGSTIIDVDDRVTDLFVLKKGWAISEKSNDGGKRSILKIHHPGDVLGMAHIPFITSPVKCWAKTDIVLCPFPRERLDSLMNKSPRLAALLLTVSQIDLALYMDKVETMGRVGAVSKIALFILQTFHRMQLMNSDLFDQFHCPLNQQEIGDAVGLSNVHVSVSMGKLEDQGLISRTKGFIRIVDLAGLADLCNFTNRYLDLDLLWLPTR